MKDVFLEQMLRMNSENRQEFIMKAQLHRLEMICKENKFIYPTSNEFVVLKSCLESSLETYYTSQKWETIINNWLSIHRCNLKRLILKHIFDVDSYLKEYCEKKSVIDIECKDYKKPFEILSFKDKLKALWNMIKGWMKG